MSRLGPKDRDISFEIFKTYLKPFIDDAFGWDETFQRGGFDTYLHPEWFSWVHLKGKKVGMVCSEIQESSLYIHLLIVFTKAQRKGIASAITNKLKEDASNKELDLTLSCFKTNVVAIELYKKLGFQITSEDEYSYGFTLEFNK